MTLKIFNSSDGSFVSQATTMGQPIELFSEAINVDELDWNNDLIVGKRPYRWSKYKLKPIEQITVLEKPKAHPTPLKIRDADGAILLETIKSLDRVPLIGLSVLNATPVGVTVPWFFLELGFTNPPYGYFFTYGEDKEVVKASGTKLLYEGLLMEDFKVRYSLGDEIYGSLVFPEVEIVLDNSTGIFNFLITNPQGAYEGRLKIYRWDPVTSSMVFEYSGIITDISFNFKILTLSFLPASRSFFDRLIPTTLNTFLLGDSSVLGRHFGRNINVNCPSIKISDTEYVNDFRYFAGWGRNKVTSVRYAWKEGGSFPAVAYAQDPLFGYLINYNSQDDYTEILFTQRIVDSSNNPLVITADIEGLVIPSYNYIVHTESFGDGGIWLPNFSNFVPGVNGGYAPDGTKTAEVICGNITNNLEQIIGTTSSVYGWFGYACVKTVPKGDYNRLKSENILFSSYNGLAQNVLKIEFYTTTSGWIAWNDATCVSGNIDLGDGWYLVWTKWNQNIVGNPQTRFRINFTAACTAYVWGTYARKNLDATAGTSPTELSQSPYQAVYNANEGSTRNFALNIKELFTGNNYGLGFYNIDSTNFDTIAMILFLRNLYCDGSLNEQISAIDIFNQLSQPLNLSITPIGPFQTWALDTGIPGSVSQASFGIGDTSRWDNIIGEPTISFKPSEEFPKKVLFGAVPIRDNMGSITSYKRKPYKEQIGVDYGKELEISNQFVRYERTADILLNYLYNRLLNSLVSISFETNELKAWNLVLNDIVTLYLPFYGINGVNYQIIEIEKGFSTVALTVKSYGTSEYIYAGTYPVDRDGNLISDLATSTTGQGSVGTPLGDIGEPSGVPILPGEGFGKVFLRKSASLGGQELVVVFADGSVQVLARSDTGSPGVLNHIPITETSVLQYEPVGGFIIGTPNCYAYLKKAAIVGDFLVPRISIDGIDQKLNIITSSDSDPGIFGATDTGVVDFFTYDQKLRAPGEVAGGTVRINYEHPTDYTAVIGLSIITSTTKTIKLLKNSGEYLRGLSLATDPKLIVSNSVGEKGWCELDCHFHKIGLEYYPALIKYNRWGGPEQVYQINIDAGIGGFYTLDTNINSRSSHLVVDNSGICWVIFIGSNGTYLCSPETGLYIDVSFLGTPTCAVWNKFYNELHVGCVNKIVYVLTISGSTISIKYTYDTIYGVPISISSDEINDRIVVTLYSTADMSGGPVGYTIFGLGGSLISPPCNFADSNLKVKDLFCHSDGYYYITYVTNATKIVTLAKLSGLTLANGGLNQIKVINSDVGVVTNVNTDFAFINMLESKPLVLSSYE